MCLALVPAEHLGPAIERFLQERAGAVLAPPFGVRWARRLPVGRVDASNRHLIETKLARGLRDHRLDHHDAPGARPAGSARVAVDVFVKHGDRARSHRGGWYRSDTKRPPLAASPCASYALFSPIRNMSSAVMLAVARKAGLHPSVHRRPDAADVVLLLSSNPHQHRGVGLLREQRRNHARHGAGRSCCQSRRRCIP